MKTIYYVKRRHELIDYLREQHNIESDTRLAKVLNLCPPTIHKIRFNKLAVSSDVLLAIYDCPRFDLTIEQIRGLIKKQAALDAEPELQAA